MPLNYFKHPTAVVETKEIGENTKIWHFVHIREKAVIGKNCNIGKSVYIDAGVWVGNNVKIQNFVSLYDGLKIGDDVFIGPSVTFTNDVNPRAAIWDKKKITPTFVKKGASIGANSTILCGLTIGECAMVGAGSVVTKDVTPFGLVYGDPAAQKGFVCYCGKKLMNGAVSETGTVHYKCSCGKSVEIKKEWIK